MFNDMTDLIVSKRISEKCWLQNLKVCDVGSPPLPAWSGCSCDGRHARAPHVSGPCCTLLKRDRRLKSEFVCKLNKNKSLYLSVNVFSAAH